MLEQHPGAPDILTTLRLHTSALDGGRIALIEVEARSATFMKSNAPGVVQALKMGVAMLTGTQPELGEVGTVSAATLAEGPPRPT